MAINTVVQAQVITQDEINVLTQPLGSRHPRSPVSDIIGQVILVRTLIVLVLGLRIRMAQTVTPEDIPLVQGLLFILD